MRIWSLNAQTHPALIPVPCRSTLDQRNDQKRNRTQDFFIPFRSLRHKKQIDQPIPDLNLNNTSTIPWQIQRSHSSSRDHSDNEPVKRRKHQKHQLLTVCITSRAHKLKFLPAEKSNENKKRETAPSILQSSIEESHIRCRESNSQKPQPQKKEDILTFEQKLFKNIVICEMKSRLIQRENGTNRCKIQLSVRRCFYVGENRTRKT